MPATFHPVTPQIWGTRAFRRLSCEVKVVYFYILTCQERVSEGLFNVAPEVVAAMTALDPTSIPAALHELEEAGLISWDADSELVLDRNALLTSPVPAPKQGKKPDGRAIGFAKRFVRLPPSTITEEFLDLAEQRSPYLVQVIEETRADILGGHSVAGEAPGSLPATPTYPPGTDDGTPTPPWPDPHAPQRGEARRGEESREEGSGGEASASNGSSPSTPARRGSEENGHDSGRSLLTLSREVVRCETCGTEFYGNPADTRRCGFCSDEGA